MQQYTLIVQENLFRRIRKILDKEKPIQEIAELLPQSASSVYKKLKLQRPLTVEELVVLCRHYGVSMDELVG